MTYYQKISLIALSQNNESLFVLRMVRVINHKRLFIIKYRLCFFKRYIMLIQVYLVLIFIPFEL